jgi:hypothetical protein
MCGFPRVAGKSTHQLKTGRAVATINFTGAPAKVMVQIRL